MTHPLRTLSRLDRVAAWRRARGNTLVFTAITSVAIFMFSSLVVDAGFLYGERTRMQRAADAAALAAARQLPQVTVCLSEGRRLAQANGYTDGTDGVTVTGLRNPFGGNPGFYQVSISRPVDLFFAPFLGVENSTVRADATASYMSPLGININGGGQYGVNGIQNLSVFGPYATYSNGDAFSPRWLNNGATNPLYNDDGYDFSIDVPPNYSSINGTSTVKVEIFDPDCWNVGNALDAGAGKVDEIRDAPGSPHPQPSNRVTTTRYNLYRPDSTPNNTTDDVLIASATYGPGVTTATDMKWITPTGMQFNMSTYGSGRYRMNVKSMDGSSENGFNLRAGPPRATGVPFNPYNGTEITAVGNLPINFNVNGTVDIELGDIPSQAAGGNVYIDKFDTDVGAVNVQYYDDHGHTWPGQLSSNGTWRMDTLAIPAGYSGGTLYARYQAGSQDTSVWQMYFDGAIPGGPGILRLVD